MARRLPAGKDEPLYVRLKRALREQIGDGLAPGHMLPSEAELCEQYAVSRMTVRLALTALVNEGVIVRRQGRGTFVAEPKRAEAIVYFGSFNQEVDTRGRSGSAKLVSFEIVRADPRVAERLRIAAGDDVIKIRRVRYVGREPLCYQVSYLARSVFPGLTDRGLVRGSLYGKLEGLLGERLIEAEESIEAILADPYRAKQLEIATGSPLLVMERVTFSRSGLAAEFNRSFYKAQSVRLLLRSQRATDDAGPHRLAFHDGQAASSKDD